MAYFKWTSEYRALVKRLYEQGMNTRQVIDYFYDHYGLNVSRRSVQRYRKGATHTPVKETKIKDVQRGTEIVLNKDGSQSSSTTLQMTSEQAKDPDFVLRAHGFDPTEWDIISARNNFWQQNSQENGLIDLYQSKITVKPKSDDELTPQDIANLFKADIKPYTVNQVARDTHNLVVPLPDLHFGITTMLDVKGHLDRLLELINKGYKTIVIEQLGDLFHSSQMWSSQTL